MAKVEKTEFRNNTKGVIGVVRYAPNGDEKAEPVEPGGTVWLTPDDQELTAKAPREAKHNPFIPHQVPILDPATGAVVDHEWVTPLTPNTEERPTPARPTPANEQDLRPEAQRLLDSEREGQRLRSGAPPEGSFAPEEEVGTPAVKPKAARTRATPSKAPVKPKRAG